MIIGLWLAISCLLAWNVPAASASPTSCAALRPFGGGQKDASATLQRCLDAAPPGGTVALPSGSYLLLSPITIRHPLTLSTAGLGTATPPCAAADRRCATLLPTMSADAIRRAPMPIDVQSDDVAIDHIILIGTRTRNGRAAQALCLSSRGRSLAGGLRANGANLRVTASVFRDFACYSAFELGSSSGLIADNLFIENGTHNRYMMWSDGLTIHDGKDLTVKDNRFVDNTDVQLIFGGCVHCTIVDNQFRHSGAESGGSFADLMIHAWPGGATSGRYDGSVFTGNDIDCGSAHRCGFGIMLGALPWYQAPTSGGSIVNNRVRNAMLGMDVEGLSGPVDVGINQISQSPGRYLASCGALRINAGVNIAPASRPFISNQALLRSASADSHAGCLLNYPHFPK